jgi:hypothetical protein
MRTDSRMVTRMLAPNALLAAGSRLILPLASRSQLLSNSICPFFNDLAEMVPKILGGRPVQWN